MAAIDCVAAAPHDVHATFEANPLVEGDNAMARPHGFARGA